MIRKKIKVMLILIISGVLLTLIVAGIYLIRLSKSQSLGSGLTQSTSQYMYEQVEIAPIGQLYQFPEGYTWHSYPHLYAIHSRTKESDKKYDPLSVKDLNEYFNATVVQVISSVSGEICILQSDKQKELKFAIKCTDIWDFDSFTNFYKAADQALKKNGHVTIGRNRLEDEELFQELIIFESEQFLVFKARNRSQLNQVLSFQDAWSPSYAAPLILCPILFVNAHYDKIDFSNFVRRRSQSECATIKKDLPKKSKASQFSDFKIRI